MLHHSRRSPIKSKSRCHSDFVINISSHISQESVGSAYIISSNIQIIQKSKYKLAKYCSRFQAQLFTINESLKYLNKGIFNGRTAIISTNSKSILLALADAYSTTFLIQTIFKSIEELQRLGINIYIELADEKTESDASLEVRELAKLGSNCHQSIAYDLIPLSFVKKLVNDKVIEIWEQRWYETSKAAHTKSFFPSVKYRRDCKKYFSCDFYICQLITNHGRFNDYLKRFNIKDCEYCDVCTTKVDNALHVIFECKKYQEERQELINVVENAGNVWPCSPKELLSKEHFKLFHKFCSEIFVNN
jgi:hypothetical protein